MNDTQEKDVASADSTKIQFSQQNETHRKRMLHQLIVQSTSPGAAEKIKTQLCFRGFSC